mgnify:CR=1 FL=1
MMSIKKSNFLLTAISAFFFMSLLFFNACTEDLCESVDCGDHGSNCIEGVCECDEGWAGFACNFCADGYYGPNCDVTNPCDAPDFPGCIENATCATDSTTGLAACFCNEGFELVDDACVPIIGVANYEGTYNQLDICGADEYDLGIVNISAHPTDDDKINLAGFGGYGHTLFAVVDGDNFEIPEQSYTNPDITYESTSFGSYNVGALTQEISLAINYILISEDTLTCDAILTKQ